MISAQATCADIAGGANLPQVLLPSGLSESGYSNGAPAVPDGYSMTTDSTGTIWFTARDSGVIGALAKASNNSCATPVTVTPTTPNSMPVGIAASAGSVWFTEFAANKIGQIDPTTKQVVNEISLPAGSTGPIGIAVAADGNLWIAASTSAQLLKYDVQSSTFTVHALAGNPRWVAAEGSNIVFSISQYHLGAIDASNANGAIEYADPSLAIGNDPAGGIAVSPVDGKTVYATARDTNTGNYVIKAWTVSAPQVISGISVPTITDATPATISLPAGAHPLQLTVDHNGRVWYSDAATGAVQAVNASSANPTVTASAVATTAAVPVIRTPEGNIVYLNASNGMSMSTNVVTSAAGGASPLSTGGVSSGGCTVGDSKAGIDPTLPGLIGAALLYLRRRFKKA